MGFRKNEDNTSNTVDKLLLGLAALALIVLKLCHVIEWPWILVLSPLWAPLAMAAIVVAIVLIWAFIENWTNNRKDKADGK